ncbi:MAG: polysaccharide biosynthesis protein [Bacteroidales bacterium]|nr:polysaccharide biosynthesis protein [Bacteroidales bacterium]
MSENTNNKRIAKNTMFLYIRMMMTMVIALYTSRVVLQVLGVDDYGIYQSVGGIVGFLSFVNSALSTGSSRFITYGLGEGNKEKLKKIFNTTQTSHILLALLIIVIAESLGYWFLHHKLIIPPERMEAAVWVFHLSIITVFFTLTQVPYNSCIIAHENMKIFAYVSIIEAVMKLLIVYMLLIGDIDKLILYAILQCVLQISIVVFYRIYCTKRYEETRFKLGIDKGIFKEIVGFSGWSLFANSAIALNNQGILLLLNIFFAPAVVAARSISIQVEMAAYQFMTNFQTATVPQIVKRYAQKDYEGSKMLLLDMTKYSFYLMLLLAIPIFFSAERLLSLWLGAVPPYTVIFLQIIIIQSLFQVFDTSFYKALYAKGQLRENALLSPTCLFINFVIVYILFKLGCSPVALSWSTMVCYAIIGLIVKPILLIRIVDYKWADVMFVVWPCLKVFVVSLIIPVGVSIYIKDIVLSEFATFAIIVTICVFSVASVVWFIGLTAEMRVRLMGVVKNKLQK